MARTKKFIAHFSEENLAKYPPEVRDLVEKGRQRGFVTQQELMHALPNLEEDIEFADEVYTLLMELGIDLIDVKDELIWGKKERAHGEEVEEVLPEDLVAIAESEDLAEDLEEGEEEVKEKEEEEVEEVAEVEAPKKKEKGKKVVDLSEIANDSIRMYLCEI